MSKVFRRTPSASMIVALVALVLAASGTAVAASKLVSGDNLIKKHSLSGNRLRSHTITASQLNMSKLGTVPSATNADHATTAANATNATNATSAGSAGSAPIANVTYVANTVSVPNDSVAHVETASCPVGTTVIGGGGQVADESTGVVNDSFPFGKAAWAATFFNWGSSTVNDTVTAICAPAAATSP
jgi:hypothetical protein